MARNFSETPRSQSVNYGNEYSWVHEWYEPEDQEVCSLIKSNKKLKGWHKVAGTKDHDSLKGIDSKCVLNLQNMKYYEHVPIVDHSKEKQIENEAKASIIDDISTSEVNREDTASQTPLNII